MPFRPLFALPLLFAACPALAEEVTCTGPFAADSSEQRLIDTFGKDNVVTGDVPGPEGSTMLGTTIFPDDPEKSIVVSWWDEENHKSISYFQLPHSATAGGVAVGMPIAEVEALNGQPFSMTGFDWDYGGLADLSAGKLGKLEGGCSLALTFTHNNEIPEKVYGEVAGDIRVDSDNPVLKDADTVVSEIALGYPDPNYPGDATSSEENQGTSEAD